ncbi:MAG TPA: class B sortase, partial [Lachnospiraceae bacterium]
TRRFIKKINSLVTFIVILSLLLFGVYALYSLWDNSQVYASAKNVQLKMQKLKPEIEDGKASFEELLQVNSDVKGWLSMEGTKIDYPILQGESNLTYINKDVYGNFALAGSIFMDSANKEDFSDAYNLIYGHHMANSNMFGDLDLYKNREFCQKYTKGLLMTRTKIYDLEVLATLLVPASDNYIFEVSQNQNVSAIKAHIEANALHSQPQLALLGENAKLLALTTCSSDFTDARTIVIAQMIER